MIGEIVLAQNLGGDVSIEGVANSTGGGAKLEVRREWGGNVPVEIGLGVVIIRSMKS